MGTLESKLDIIQQGMLAKWMCILIFQIFICFSIWKGIQLAIKIFCRPFLTCFISIFETVQLPLDNIRNSNLEEN